MRLQKYIAKSGVSSRRKAEKLIVDGRIKVNGKLVKELGSKVDPKKDKVFFDDKLIEIEEDKVYILLNKPRSYVTTVQDEFDRPIVLDLIEGVEERIFPVGRLDYDTSGLLLLTNDGDLTNKLTHPSYEVEKSYKALVEGITNDRELDAMREGLVIEGRKTYPARVDLLETTDNSSLLRITIHEGRNRQVRKMCSAIGHPVIELERVSLGPIRLKGLDLGEWRYLSDLEIEKLRKTIK